jgi:hypothetical protein
MSKALRLIYYPRHSAIWRTLPSVLLIYVLMLPSQWGLFAATDNDSAARHVFATAQFILLLALVWSLFSYFSSVEHPQCRELMDALHHPSRLCALALWLEHQIQTVPLYIIYFVLLPFQPRIVPLLLFQSVCICAAFSCFTSLFRSALVGTVLCLITPVISFITDSYIPLLLVQTNCLPSELTPTYWLTHSGIILVCLVLTRIARKTSRY